MYLELQKRYEDTKVIILITSYLLCTVKSNHIVLICEMKTVKGGKLPGANVMV
jgi:hypothetical protein